MKRLLLLSLVTILLACWTIANADSKSSDPKPIGINASELAVSKQELRTGQYKAAGHLNDRESRFIYQEYERPEPEAETFIPRKLLSNKVYPDRGQNTWIKIAEQYGTEEQVTRLHELMADGVISDDELEQYWALTKGIMQEMRTTRSQDYEPPLILDIIPESEPNDNPEEADTMGCGDRVECAHLIGAVFPDPPVDGADWFTFELDGTNDYWAVTCSTYDAPGCSDPDSSIGDTWMNLYDETMQLIAQSMPFGGYAKIDANSLIPGTYYLEVTPYSFGSNPLGYYNIDLFCEEGSPAPIGDVCEDPIIIESLPFTDIRSTCDYNDDYYLPGNDVVYELTISEPTVIKVSLCSTANHNFDSFIGIQTDANPYMPTYCGNDLFWYAGTWSGCEAGNSNAEIPYIELMYAGAYQITVDHFGDCSEYTIEVEEIPPCVLECPSENAYVEQEICGDDDNGGCNMWDPTFEHINAGDTVCGTFYLDNVNMIRDTDWYEFTLSEERTKVTVSGMAEYHYQLMILRPGFPDPCGENIAVEGYLTTYPCNEGSFECYLRPGNYWVFASTGPSMVYPPPEAACGDNDSYYFTLTCEPVPSGAPENDWCEDVTPVALNDGDNLTFYGNNIGATSDCHLFYPYGEVWHAFTTSERLDITIDNCTTVPPFLNFSNAIFGNCPCSEDDYRIDYPFPECGDGNFVWHFRNVEPGIWYFPVIADEELAYGDYALNVSAVASPPPPPNDDCENALPIVEDESIELNTTYAVHDGSGLCMLGPNLWYVYTATATGNVCVKFAGQYMGQMLAVYNGSECPATTLLECANAAQGNPPYCEAVFSAIEGNQYLIEVGGSDEFPNTGVGELSVMTVPNHDVGVIRIKEPEHILFDGISDYPIIASIFNYGLNQETFDVVASDDYGFSSSYSNLTLNAGEEITILFSDLYASPSDTCEVHNFTISTQLDGDQVPENDAISTIYSYARTPQTTYQYDDGDEENVQVMYLTPENSIWAMEYIAQAREDIVSIGYLALGQTVFNPTVDPVKLFLFLDLDDDGVPDEPAVYEIYVNPPADEPLWAYAVLPCSVTVEAGQSFWVGWQDPHITDEDEGLWMDWAADWTSMAWLKWVDGEWYNPPLYYYRDPFLRAWTVPNSGYAYLPGDANMSVGSWPPQVIGGDVTYMVGYFRGINAPCNLGDPGLFCAADANGDCQIIGSDVTKMVTYFRGLTQLSYCSDYEPAWLTPIDLPVEAPAGWPNCETPVTGTIKPIPDAE